MIVEKNSVFHLSGERGWRGGESQLALLVRHLDAGWKGRMLVPDNSELYLRLTALHVEPMSGFGFQHPLAGLRLRRMIEGQNGRVLLHAHSSKALETALLARFGQKVPLVVSRHNAFSVKSGWKYRMADAVIAVSQAARGALARAKVPVSRITVIPPAVDRERFANPTTERFGISDKAVVVLCAAAFAEEKDHETLLKAWKQVEAEERDAHLVLAGDGPLRAAMHQFCRELGLERVLFVGWRDDLPDLVAGCDIAVLSSRLEGLPTFLCEAQWVGKPVAATDAGGAGEAIANGHTGFLSEVADPVALAQNLLRLTKNADLRKKFGLAAAARAQRLFDPNAVASAHQRVYESVLEGF
ncbi:glycosyltransferase family 4 protein [Nitratireductor thuwali]|uniref:N-acetyl-alpha-D-glucosaminyl L-malate synthase n=1 Tax=Nitratireductor thuwali TaxID=2267699 RepID=A0ABY5MGH3_9HYPH|nr:N-acetyl-alpha-D-glucosaminyl L-malate synthase [Nitratireductor thuwali]